MEKILITVITLYALFVGIYFLYLKAGKKRRKDIVGKTSSLRETGQIKTDIVGKSRFDLNASKPINAKSTPIDATLQKNENPQENHHTFAPPDDKRPSAEVPREELDKAFSDTPADDEPDKAISENPSDEKEETLSDTPPDEENKPMDIDYPLEFETGDETEDEEDETEEVEGAARAALAFGVRFEDLGNAVRTVNHPEKATGEQKQKAGDTLLEMRRTDMFEQVVSGKPDAKRIVSELMAESLAEFHRRKDKEAGITGGGNKVPDNFNIRDFV